MKHPAKALMAAVLALILAFTLLPTAVLAADPVVKEISTGDHDELINEYRQIYAEQLKAQTEAFSIKLMGSALDLYEFAEGKLVLKSTGKEDPYFPNDETSIKNTIKMLINEFSSVPSNEYIANVIASQGIGINYKFDGQMHITVNFSIIWDETKDQTADVRYWAKGWVAENLEGINGTYEKVKAIHDYIIETYSYDSSLKIYTAHGMLTSGKGVCEAYSLLARALLDAAGIESRLVVFVDAAATNDQGTDNHMWNLVRIGGYWYHMDVTWDDPVGGSLRYDYFLKSDETMEKNHSWNRSRVPAAPYDYGSAPPIPPDSSSNNSTGSSSAAGSSSKPSASSKTAGSSSASSKHGVSVAPNISLPGTGPSQPGTPAVSGAGNVSRDYGLYSEGGGYVSFAPAGGEQTSGNGSLRILWLVLAIMFAAAGAAAVFIVIKRAKDSQ